MKALKKEMGEGEDIDDEIEAIEKKIKDSGMPKEATEKVNTELNKFKLMPPMSAEASVVRVIPVPATKVRVSVVESATTLFCPDTAKVLKRF